MLERWRLHDIHHRVRDEVQQIHSLASRYASESRNPAARAEFEAIGQRALSVAALHDHLLGVGMGRQVEFGGYLAALCAKIADAEDLGARGVRLGVEVEAVELDTGTATDLGIVVYELVANSAEHAFGGQGGRVAVRLVRDNGDGAGRALLTVADDGRGLTGSGSGASHGLKLAQHLVERAGGELTRGPPPGTVWQVRIRA